MAVKKIVLATVFFGLCFVSCTDVNKTKTESQAKETTTISPQQNNMKSFISLFEIPATEISRAITFYQAILDIKIEKMEMPDMQMGIFPYEGQMVQGIILKTQGSKPSANGVTIYLNGGDNLQVILDKVEKNGGKILTPKTAHADGNGYFAIFLDTEGNKIGLNSPN
jgi:predicted enzyme related to lactoylglutathione lyase